MDGARLEDQQKGAHCVISVTISLNDAYLDFGNIRTSCIPFRLYPKLLLHSDSTSYSIPHPSQPHGLLNILIITIISISVYVTNRLQHRRTRICPLGLISLLQKNTMITLIQPLKASFGA